MMKKLLIATAMLFSFEAKADDNMYRNMGWMYGVSHIGTEFTLKVVKAKKEPTALEKAFAGVLVFGVMGQAGIASSRDDQEIFLNGTAIGAGIMTGIVFQTEW